MHVAYLTWLLKPLVQVFIVSKAKVANWRFLAYLLTDVNQYQKLRKCCAQRLRTANQICYRTGCSYVPYKQ